jgi:hypothetical protein
MSKKIVDEKHSKEALKQMINDRKQGEPVEEVLATFCQRYSVAMNSCREIYNELVAEGEIKEKPL